MEHDNYHLHYIILKIPPKYVLLGPTKDVNFENSGCSRMIDEK